MRLYTQAEMDASPSRADWFRRATEGGRRGPLLILWMILVCVAGAYACSTAPGLAERAAGTGIGDGSGGWVSLATGLGVTMLTAALIVAPYPLIMRPYRPRRTLLWLRRFHMTEHKWFPVEKALNASRTFVAAPLTIRDPRMAADHSAGSPIVAALRVIRYLLMLPAIAMLLVFVLLTLSVVFPDQFGSTTSFNIASDDAGKASSWVIVAIFSGIGAALLALFWGLSLLVWNMLRSLEGRFGYVVLPKTGRAAVAKLDRFFNDVSRGAHAAGRMRIFRTHDDSWRAVVGCAIARADLILLDVSQLTGNVEWEIEQVFTARAPESVIIAVQQSETTGAIDPEVIDRLKEIAGPERFAKVQLLEYPAHRKLGLGSAIHTVSDAIRERLFDALDNSAAAASLEPRTS